MNPYYVLDADQVSGDGITHTWHLLLSSSQPSGREGRELRLQKQAQSTKYKVISSVIKLQSALGQGNRTSSSVQVR